MIKKINLIKDFGIFKNFSGSQLDEFKKKNLIYGWNYSGKTTLSKLFENLEFSNCNRHFNGSQFSIEFENNNAKKTITHSSIDECPNKVKTFNSEYIKRIFTWETPDTGIEPISFYLGDPAGNLVTEIASLKSKNSRLTLVKDNRYKKSVTEFLHYNKSNGKFSSQAKEIREDYLPRLLQQHEFNKSHFSNRLNVLKEDLDANILEEEFKNRTKDEALAQKEHDGIAEIKIAVENLNSIGEKVVALLKDSAPRSVSFADLDSDQKLFNWVQDGLDIHKESQTCHFCTNPIPQDRIEQLNTYYSNKLKEIQDEIEKLQSEIVEERKKIEITFENELKISELNRSEYNLGLSIYKAEKTKYLNQLSIFEDDISRKKSSLFNSIDPSPYVNVTTKSQIEEINKVIKKHNDWVNEFAERKQAATNKILNHYVAEYAKEEDYLSKENQNISARQRIETIEAQINTNKSQIKIKNAQLSDMVKGAEELNGSLELLLNRNDIKIEVENEKFTLKRNEHTATNLSEGEKSAIAFSYFLTELKSIKEDGSLPNTIIFIDDPISSLDSNHIFQVRSLIQKFFKENEFGQLFISTHSFEFLSVLLDTKLFGRLESTTSESKRPLYFIQRNNNNVATIKKLPKAFSSYKSEYVGLFQILNEYNTSIDKENFPHLLILPNAVRRFLELYTLMKYPSEKEVDKRVKEVFESGDQTYHSTKLLHWFSHQNKFEMVSTHDDKLLQITEAVEELFNYIENADSLHWKGLNGG